jgi:aspartate-semialdehyde dehydrogenase
MVEKKKIRVAVVGATGIAGQQFLACLDNHPWFEVAILAASQRSAGKTYAEAIRRDNGATGWWAEGDVPSNCRGLVVADSDQFDPASVGLIFTAIDEAGPAKVLETKYAATTPVVSAASGFRMEKDSPLLIPGVNSDHAGLLAHMAKARGWKGFVTAIPNCTTTGLAVSLAPLVKQFGVKTVFMTSMQAVSGAGRSPGVLGLDILENVIPYIPSEEEKVQRELAKIFGRLESDSVAPAPMAVSCSCNRVGVLEGHTESAFVSLEKPATLEQAAAAMSGFAPEELKGLPTAPADGRLIHLHVDPFRPQPRLDRERGGGMVTTVGRLRQDPVLPNGFKYSLVSHNTKMGAAKGAVLVAELLVQKGLISRP